MLKHQTPDRFAKSLCDVGAALRSGSPLLTHAAHAEDIDAIRTRPVTEGLLPNVLFIIDNTANWSERRSPAPDSATARQPRTCEPDEEGTKMGAEKCALYIRSSAA
jgi:hypothetical protein